MLFALFVVVSHCAPGVVGRSLAHLEAGIDVDFSAPVPMLPFAKPANTSAILPDQGSSLAAALKRWTTLGRLDLFGLWNSVSSSAAGDNAQGPVLFAAIPLAASAFFALRWIWYRNRPSEPFETPAEVARQRKLFDDASKGTLGSLSDRCRLWDFLRTYLKVIAGALTILILASMVLPYLDFSYIIIGCFAAVALVYDRQVNQVIMEGQKKSGIDLSV